MTLVYLFGAAGLAIWAFTPRRKPSKGKPIACLEASREQTLTYVPKNFRGTTP